jgi:hypothetical protein
VTPYTLTHPKLISATVLAACKAVRVRMGTSCKALSAWFGTHASDACMVDTTCMVAVQPCNTTLAWV